MRKNGWIIASVVMVTVFITLLAQHWLPLQRWLIPQSVQSVLTRQDTELLGYTRYATYLTASKEALSGQAKLLTTTVNRDESMTETIERVMLPRLSSKLASHATIAVHYHVEYAFGYDLQPQAFDIRAGAQGIEIHVKPPTLLTAPAVSQLSHEVLSSGLLTDEDMATVNLYERVAEQARTQGEAMSRDSAVVALCEKQLIAFVADFLAKQQGMKIVPQIKVMYDYH